MSTAHSNGTVVIEWSPGRVRRFNPTQDTWVSGEKISDVVRAGETIIVAPSRRVTYLKSARVPNVNASEVRKVLDVQLNQLLPIPSNLAASDFRLTSNVDSEGRLAIVCAVRAEHLEDIYSEAKAAGAQIKQVIPVAFASQALAKEQGVSDCTVIELTPDGLAIDVVAGGELRYSRVAAGVSTEDQIGAELKRTEAVSGTTASGATLATGGLPVANATVHIRPPSISALNANLADQIGISLEPPALVAQRESRRRSSRLRLALLSAAAAVVTWLFVYFSYSDARKQVESAVRKRAAILKTLRSAQTAAQNHSQTRVNMETEVRNLFMPAQKADEVAAVVSQCVPQGLWLSGFVFERGKPLQIRGSALTSAQVTTFVDKLSQTSRFRDIKLQFINDASIDLIKVVQFSLSAHVVGNLPLDNKSGGK